MATRKKHFSGGSFRGKHTTPIDGTEKVIDAVRRIPGIGIALGFIDFKRGGSGGGNIRIKLIAESGRHLMKVFRGSKGQEVSLFGNVSLEEVKHAIEEDKSCRQSGVSVEICQLSP